MRSKLRPLARAGFAVTLVTAGLGVVTSAPAHAANCVFTVKDVDGHVGDEVQALELQERGGDEIFLRLNGTRFPASGAVSFTSAGQGRPASAFGNPQQAFAGSIRVQLIEKDPLFNDEIGDVFLPCQPLAATLQLINSGTGAYNVEFEITQS